jgi:phage tail-like protein
MDRPSLQPFSPPLVGFRFDVFFIRGGTQANTFDILFQKVSGIGATVNTSPREEGGQNLFTQRLPERIEHDNLVLERGLMVDSPLTTEFLETLTQFRFTPVDVLVTLLDEANRSLMSWMFLQAYPVRWSIGDLDAQSNTVVIERLELAYQRLQPIGL